MKRRLMLAVLAAALVAGLTPLMGSPAQAQPCGSAREVAVFTQYGTHLPEGMRDPVYNRDSVANPTIDYNFFGCLGDPDVNFNSQFILPGQNLISSRWLPGGGVSTYLFDGILNASGPVVQTVDATLAPVTQSPRLSLNPAALGCVGASFDGGRGRIEYCTLSNWTP
ncbi:MAG TPA: hypothetical protein VNE62_06710 [Actinomycetota bacterium]|nr:hypothetical protein [Actinomycetota bacterium]